MNSETLERIETYLVQHLLLEVDSSPFHPVDLNFTNQEGKSLLHFACEHGLENLCSTLLRLGANPNTFDGFGTTPLMIACKFGHFEIVNCLLIAGADPTCINDYGIDLLPLVIMNGDMDFFLKLRNFARNDYFSILGRITLISLASSLGKTDFVKFLSSMFPNKIDNAVEKSGMTPLMLAVSGGFSGTVDTLIEIGADLNLMNSYSMTALQIAKSMNNLKIEKILDPFFTMPTLISIPSPTRFKNYATTPADLNLLNVPLENSNVLKHPLTPNICVSPKPSKKSRTKEFFQLKHLKRRSRSVENKFTFKYNESENKDVLEYILISTNLYELWPIFQLHEINFKTFLTMNDEDLKSIGIIKTSLRSKLLKVIKHNKRIFC